MGSRLVLSQTDQRNQSRDPGDPCLPHGSHKRYPHLHPTQEQKIAKEGKRVCLQRHERLPPECLHNENGSPETEEGGLRM